ncbi:MAG: hypothetical protein K2Y27_32110 [Xanthobacteraceae bacterium]|nr:hypothetical protein [Xanthobacteraceae bacterium]
MRRREFLVGGAAVMAASSPFAPQPRQAAATAIASAGFVNSGTPDAPAA